MGELLLVGDIGGTNARFALARDGVLDHQAIAETAAHPTLEAAALEYLRDKPAPSAAALAVAGPVGDGLISMTNSPWSFSRASLEAALKCPVEIVNDFAAQARAIPFLQPSEYLGIPHAVPRAPLEGRQVIAVLGPGTGLGVATLLHVDGIWIDLPGEGGHATLAPANPGEDRIIAALRERWEHVSAERALSGEGLVSLYEAICEIRGVLPERRTPAEITIAATGPERDPQAWLCAHAFDVFCAMLGTVAGNLALTVGATGGVYIAGGIVRRFPAALAASRFRYRFEEKGRLGVWLRTVPTYLMLSETPALTGLANWGRVGARASDRRRP